MNCFNQAKQFKIWATQVLKEYLKKCFALNDDLLKQAGGDGYWQKLLERIRDIRSSEKVFYRQIKYRNTNLTLLFFTNNKYSPKFWWKWRMIFNAG